MKELSFIQRISSYILIIAFVAYTCFAFVEFSCFCLLSIKGLFRNLIQNSANEQLYNLGLPNIYEPLGSPKDGAWAWSILMSSSPVYDGEVWADEYWKVEHERYRNYLKEPLNIFQSNVIFREMPRNTKYVNVNQNGQRHTVNIYPAKYNMTKKVFMFGASTMFGTGVPDEHTIPSILSQYLNNKSKNVFYEVSNFGTGAFILEQDMILFLEEVKKGNLPDIAIFYHGVNDSYAGIYSPGKPGRYLGSDQLEKKFTYNPNRDTGLNNLNFIKLISMIKFKFTTQDISKKPYQDKDYKTRAKELIKYYKATIEIIRHICDKHQIVPYFIWQPTLTYGNKTLNKFEKALIENPALLSIGSFNKQDGISQTKVLNMTYQMIEENSFQGMNFYNLSHIFDLISDPTYVDFVHLGRRGNEIIAEKLLQIIKNQAM